MLDLLISYINFLILSISYIVKKFTFRPPNPPKYKIKKNELNNKEEIYFLLETSDLKLAYRVIKPNKFDIKYTKVSDIKNNKEIPILIITPKIEQKICVIYCQGNNGDLGTSLFECHEISYKCFVTVVTFEYPGYGICKDEQIKESEFFHRIKLIYMYIIDKLNFNPNRIFLYGFSLGTGIVFDFACKNEYPVAGMILQSPFLSILRTIYNIRKTRYFDLFNNCDKAKNICTDILFLHGNKDKTVPYNHGRILSQLIPEKYFYNFLTVDGAQHNDLIKLCKDDMFDYIKDFMSECIAKSKRKIQFNNYLQKLFFSKKKNFYLESEDQDLKDEKESNDSEINNNNNQGKNKANTFSNFKINNIYKDVSKEEHKNNINNKYNNKNLHGIESSDFQILSKNKDLNSVLSTMNNNKNKEKNISQKNKKYYHVIIGTNKMRNKDKFWVIYKKNEDIKNKKLDKNYFHEKGNSLFNITSSNICINN